MGASLFTFVLLLACAAGILGQDAGGAPVDEDPRKSTTTTTPTTITSSSTHQSTTESTDKPSTTTHLTTTRRTDPPTTPDTTHSSPTTSPQPTTSLPPTTIAPPVPNPEIGTWKIYYNETSNYTCFELDMAAQFILDNNTQKINIPPDASVNNGFGCSKDDQHLVLQWPEQNGTFIAEFTFISRNATDKEEKPIVYLSNLTLSLQEAGGKPKLVAYMNESDNDLFAAHVGNYYKCNASLTIKLVAGQSVTVSNVQVQANMENAFGKPEECAADYPTNDIVPIAVGCALAGLVVIVLIAYVVGRRLSRKRGYQSV